MYFTGIFMLLFRSGFPRYSGLLYITYALSYTVPAGNTITLFWSFRPESSVHFFFDVPSISTLECFAYILLHAFQRMDAVQVDQFL